MIFVMGVGNVQEEQLSFMTTWILSVTLLFMVKLYVVVAKTWHGENTKHVKF